MTAFVRNAALLTAALVGLAPVAAAEQSWFSSMGESIKRGWSGMVQSVKPAAPPSSSPTDPIALATKSKPSPELYTAMGKWYEQAGNPGEAKRHFEMAIGLRANYAPALAGLARLKAAAGDRAEAIRLYQQAVRQAPSDASIFNDLGICFAQQKMLVESRAAIERAIQLQPQNALYRNNVAAVLVDIGDADTALVHLKASGTSEAVAHYNLGYLLFKKGNTVTAAHHFAIAAQKDPSLVHARTMLGRAGGLPGRAPLAQQAETAGSNEPPIESPRWTSQPDLPSQPPIEGPRWTRQPDLPSQPPVAAGPDLPAVVHRAEPLPAGAQRAEPLPAAPPGYPSLPLVAQAPLPPPTPVVRPLPPVDPPGTAEAAPLPRVADRDVVRPLPPVFVPSPR